MKTKVIILSALCLVFSVFAFYSLWGKLPEWLSPAGLQSHGVFHWGVLALCILWLWLKRADILPEMQKNSFSLPFIIAGTAAVAISILLTRFDNLFVFPVLMGWLGFFAIFFGKAAIIPSVLLAIYGFSLVFPIIMVEWFGEPSVIPVTKTVSFVTAVLGLPVEFEGAVIHYTSLNGDVISRIITPECAGYQTIGVFIALFSLMMLDIRLPIRKAWWVFLLSLAGTWLQNIIRVVVSVAAGYYWGSSAIETMHSNIPYVIFPLWYALFAFIYLWQAGWRRAPREV
ncbi:MAG: exosortase/archaeosortase family protein [Dehalococcoidales bacterium]|nr:MAG: exosortase/archaeosortase family protein [Dehalococcoidales bacterium]